MKCSPPLVTFSLVGTNIPLSSPTISKERIIKLHFWILVIVTLYTVFKKHYCPLMLIQYN
jgi:hypothetical protein